MKKNSIISLLLIFALLCCLLSSCSNLHKIEYDNGFYVDRSNGIKYISAPVSYEPVSVGEEYAKCGDTILHRVPNVDPKLWLTEEYDGIGALYYAQGVNFPSIGNFNTTVIHLCTSEILTIGIGSIEDDDVIAKIVDAVDNGDDVVPGEVSVRYFLKFASDDYPWLYYSVVYFASSDGDHYIYDRSTKRTVSVGSLISDILPDA